VAVGLGGILAVHVGTRLHGSTAEVHTVVAGLGGRPNTRASLAGC
jgi:pyruvate ferredoxin oxidoreductase alpha subunit